MKAPLLVGLLLISSVISMTFILQTGKSEFSEENSYIVYADFSDASGIRWKTRVQVNGQILAASQISVIIAAKTVRLPHVLHFASVTNTPSIKMHG